MSARSRGPRVITVVKDCMSFLGAWGIIYYQVLIVPPGQADGRILALAAVLLGIPGASVFLPQLLSSLAGAAVSAGTTGSGSDASSPR